MLHITVTSWLTIVDYKESITSNNWEKNYKIILRGAALTLLRQADFSYHAARRGAPTAERGRVRCSVAISTAWHKNDYVQGQSLG